MDIKATQLKNNTQIAETVSTAVRTPAKTMEDGKTFVDAMSDLPNKIDTANPAVQKAATDVENKSFNSKDGNSFEFISKSEKDFNMNVIKNNEAMSVKERQAVHKAAEKELVDEIVLMNNKHNFDIKNLDKNEFNKSEISVAQKFDKTEVKPDFKADVKSENPNNKIEISENVSKPINSENLIMSECIENVVSNAPENDVDILMQNVEVPEVKIAEGEVEELLLPDKNAKTEIFPQPEILENFEEPIVIKSEAQNNAEPIAKEKAEVIGQLANEEINVKENDNLQKLQKNEETILTKTEVSPKKTEEKTLTKAEVLPEKADEKSFEVKDFDVKDDKIKILENNLKSEKVLQDKPSVKPSKPEKTEVQKIDDVKVQKVEVPKADLITENEVVQEVKAFEKPEKVAFAENLINQNKIDEKKDLKNDKPSLSKISNVKKDMLNEVENVGKVKDIADEVKVNAVEMKPVVPEDIKVIKMEVVNPLAELNNSMNTTKTSDIVKFIDANLSTDNVKTTKTNSSKAAEAAKKASSEKTIKMTEADAKFFNNLIETNQQVIEGTKTADQTNNNLLRDVETAQSAQVSKTLLNALKESQENNKAFRVDFDKDISVVLRVNKDGHISAEFLPGDEAVEQYLKSNIPLLKQKFSDEGLEYDNLSYRQHKKEDKERQNRGNKKENGYE